ncbi:f-box domain-containing protein [Diaporthe eres]|nr:f-box domain-containing protein [Diaporthe eres]
MSRQDLDNEELLSLLSDPHQAPFLARTMIPMCDPPKPTGPWQPQGNHCPLGVLAILPVELLHELLEKLDLYEVFGLSEEQARQLPTILTIPGIYGLAQEPNPYRYKLVSARAAIELAVSVRGSLESLDLQVALELVVCGRYDDLFTVREDRDMFSLGPEDRYFGMASIPFASLTGSHLIEDGLFCNGCRWMSTKRPRFPESFPESAVDHVGPSGCDPHWVLSGLKRRAYSRIGFLEHIKHCYGANQLICSWKDGI